MLYEAELDSQVTEAEYRALENDSALLHNQLSQFELKQMNLISSKKYEIERSESLFVLLQKKVAATNVKAPLAGVILTKNTERLKGRWVKEGEPVIQMADLEKMEFLAEVNQRDEHKVTSGQSVRIFFEAFPHREYKVFEGCIKEVSVEPSVSSQGVFFETKIEVYEPWVEIEDHSRVYLKPGLVGKAEIVARPDLRLYQLLLKDVFKR
jgi:multidrug resistance efflux pump